MYRNHRVCFVSLQQHHQTRRKLFEISHSLRSMMYGQDRYRRRYWVLPHCGGVFIEAMESGEGSWCFFFVLGCISLLFWLHRIFNAHSNNNKYLEITNHCNRFDVAEIGRRKWCLCICSAASSAVFGSARYADDDLLYLNPLRLISGCICKL